MCQTQDGKKKCCGKCKKGFDKAAPKTDAPVVTPPATPKKTCCGGGCTPKK